MNTMMPRLAGGKDVYRGHGRPQPRECQAIADHYRELADGTRNEALREGYLAQATSWQRVADRELREMGVAA